MEDLRLDIRFALRSLRRNPAYVVAVVATLALGIGANTAMFSVLRSVLMAPLPQANGDRVVQLFQPNANSETTGFSPLEMSDYRNATPSVESIVEYHSMPFTFIGATEPQRLQTGVVSAEYFEVLGVSPLLGRTFRIGEDQTGSDPVLVLSWEYWQRAFGGDPNVVGATFRMNDRVHTVVGVLPRIPQYPDENDVYMPASSCPFRSSPGWAENRTSRQPTFALLRSGVARDAAVADLRVIATRLHETYPDAYPADGRFTIAAVPLAEVMTDDARPSILMLLAATSFLLLIVCANVVNLAVVRLMRRDQELSTRLALGASSGRVVRQVVTESAMLALAGGAAGLIVAQFTLRMLVPLVARFSPRAHEIGLDGGVLLFAAAVAIGAGVFGGLLPALMRLRQLNVVPGNSDGRNTASSRHGRLRGALIVTQVAVSLVLLVGAGLMIRSLVELQRVAPGFDPERVLTARIDLNWTRYANTDQSTAFYRAVEQRLAAIPAIEEAAFASSFPLNGDPAAQITVTTDSDEPGAEGVRIGVNSVSSTYFDVLGINVMQGRGLDDGDARQGTPLAAVLTAASAKRLFREESAVGRRISTDGGQTWGTIVGVVGDMRHELEQDFEAMAFAHVYRFHTTQSRLLVRGRLPAAQLERVVRDVIAEVDVEQPVTDVRTIAQFRNATLAPRRIVATLLGAFAALALVITAVGLAGIVAFAVADRAKEISIRVALGASRGNVIRIVLQQALFLTAAGLAVGTVAAVLFARLLGSFLFGVPATDTATFVTVAMVLLAVAAVAGAAPTHRALRIEPVRALRGP